MAERRKDSKKRVLKEGEYQRSNGTYEYRWRSENGKRNNVYAKSLEELREKEAEIQRDRSDGIRSEARNATINDIHEQWLQLKKGLKAEEAAAYSGIGINKLREMSDSKDCTFVLWNGTKRLVKRRRLDEHLDRLFSI